MTKERPIIFSGAMVRAILADHKTQTRRVVKPQPIITERGCPSWGTPGGKRIRNGPRSAFGGSMVTMTELIGEYCPYGIPGDRLWGKETCMIWTRDDGAQNYGIPRPVIYADDPKWLTVQRDATRLRSEGYPRGGISCWKLTSSIHMPRWASRILLEVTGVRVERVQEISESAAFEEGCTGDGYSLTAESFALARQEFAALWDTLNAKRKVSRSDMGTFPADFRPYTWAANPHVWVVEFKRLNAGACGD